MSETVYITEEQRDLILNLFGGVRKERVGEMVEALKEAEACMSIVEPRSDKAEYLRTLGVVRSALSHASQTTGGEE